ncbi:MAG: hypothetical protein AB7O45_09810 [Alphaproteobacteria bacterium]
MSGRKPALPGVQRDVDALLNGDPAAPPAGPAADAPSREPGAPAADVVRFPTEATAAAEPRQANGAHGASARDFDRAALQELASQFPSAGAPARPADPPVGADSAPAAPVDPPPSAAAAPRGDPADAGGPVQAGVGMLDRALFGDNPMRRWAVMAGIALVGLVLVVLLEAAFLSRPGPATTPGPTAGEEAREALRAELSEVQGRVAAIEAASRSNAGAVADLRGRLDAHLSATTAAAASDGVRLGLIVLRMERLATGGQPFAAELAAAREATGAGTDLSSALAQLEPFAANGAPTKRDLALRVSAQAPRLAAMSEANDGILDRVGGMFSRKPSNETVAAAVIARAQAELDVGNLAAAVRQLQRLPPPLRQAAAPWIAAAEQRVAVDAALDQVSKLAFQAIAKTP